MNHHNKLLGVLGGLGPMSTVYFCELLTSHTLAFSDAEHIDMLISSRATTPDRTAYILGRSDRDPLPVMLADAKRLEQAGVDLLVIPCNTAHYFYDGLQSALHIPMLNIIDETVAMLSRMGIGCFGLLATEGTVSSGSYARSCEKYGMQCLTPNSEEQAVISSIIYNSIKQNRPVDRTEFLRVADSLCARGCERLVLGCTELSLLKRQGLDDAVFIDSLEVLAWSAILACGKTPVGFPADFGGVPV